MPEETKPLHVQVAEALGWTDFGQCCESGWHGYPDTESWMNYYDYGDKHTCGCDPDRSVAPIPRYDTDWSATGPLIEKYGINLFKYAGEITDPAWQAVHTSESHSHLVAHADSALEAVCNLVLYLERDGRLKAA